MLTPAKAKEKPSIASKKVLNTHRKNGTESFLLTEKIRTLEHKQSQKNIDIDMEVNSLKKRMENVQRVKKRIGLSTERRLLLKSQGFTIRVCKGGPEDKIVLRRESLEVEAGNWATLLTNPPDFTLPDESLEIQDVVESSEPCSSSLESRSNERMRSFSLSSVADCRPTQVSRYRVIEPPLRPGSRRGFSSLSSTLISKNDQEINRESHDEFSMPMSERLTGWDFVRNRPFSGRSLFVDAVIAARDNNYFESNEDTTGNHWKRRNKASRRAKSAPVKVRPRTVVSARERTSHKPGGVKKELKIRSSVTSSESHEDLTAAKLAIDETVDMNGQRQVSRRRQGQEEDKDNSCASNDRHDRKLLPYKARASDSILDKTECVVDKEKTKASQAQNAGENESRNALNELLINNKEKCNKRSKYANKSNELLTTQTSRVSSSEVHADNLNPVPVKEQEVVALEDSEVQESCFENKQEKEPIKNAAVKGFVDSGAAAQVTSGKTYLSVPDKTSRMATRRHSTDSETYRKNRFHGNAARKKCENDETDIKSHVTLQLPTSNMLNRRMSHPPRIVTMMHPEGKIRKRKPLKNEDEVVYAYDARPDKSLSKGYTAMQMTVGGRQVKLSMATFPKESGNATANRAKVNAKLTSFKGKP